MSSIDEARRAQYGARVLASAVAEVETTAGAASYALLRAALGPFQLVAGGLLDRGEVWTTLTRAGLARGVTAAEVPGILKRAERRGAEHPRRWSPESPSPDGESPRKASASAPTVNRVNRASAETWPAVPDDVQGLLRAVWRAVEGQGWHEWPADVVTWCRGRGLDPDEAVTFGARVLEVPAVVEAIRAAGIDAARAAGFLWEVEGKPRARWFPFRGEGFGGLSVPVWHPACHGWPVGWQWRDTRKASGRKSWAMQGGLTWRRWPFGLWWPSDAVLGPMAGPLRPLVIVEGEADAMAMALPAFGGIDEGLRLDVIGTPGTDWRADWSGLFAGRPCVVVAVDRDEAGQGLARVIGEAAAAQGVPVASISAPTKVHGTGEPSGAKDWGDAIRAGWPRSVLVEAWRRKAREAMRDEQRMV